jgi:hypothetical protein
MNVYNRAIAQGKPLPVDTLQTPTLGIETTDLLQCNLAPTKFFVAETLPCDIFYYWEFGNSATAEVFRSEYNSARVKKKSGVGPHSYL